MQGDLGASAKAGSALGACQSETRRDGAILCQDQAKKRCAYPNTGKILCAGTGAKSPVPPGFRLAGAQRRTGLGLCTQNALQPFRHRIAAPIEKQN